jgi:hypothetical protein
MCLLTQALKNKFEKQEIFDKTKLLFTKLGIVRHNNKNLRISLDRVLMSSEYWKKDERTLFGYCMIVLRTLKHISIIFGSVDDDSAKFKRISSVPYLSRSCTRSSVPFANEFIIIKTLRRKYNGLLSSWISDNKRGTTPCCMMNFFCLLDPITRFLILFVASKHASSFSENKLSKYDRKLSTSYKKKKVKR